MQIRCRMTVDPCAYIRLVSKRSSMYAQGSTVSLHLIWCIASIMTMLSLAINLAWESYVADNES